MDKSAQAMAASDPEGPELADADLIAAARAGDTEAYGVLYARHSHAARALARQLGRDDAESDDLVAETFARVLDVLSRGGGPEVGFRAYALTAMRRIKYDRARGEARQVVLDDLDPYAPGVPFDDRTLEGLERSMVARAFASLPERWQTVLWHTAIEGERPAEVAPLLGISAGSVAALAYRAREGLRQAYLQMHLSGAVQEGCQPALERMGAYVRGGLSRRETRVVERHIDECDKCRGLYLELADVNSSLRTIIGPIILGPAVGGYLASVHGGAGLFGALWLRHLRRVPKQAAGAAAVVAALAIALPLGWMAWQGDTSDHVGGGGQGGQAEAAAPGGAPPSSNNPAPSQKNPPAAHHPHKQQGASESSAGGGDSSPWGRPDGGAGSSSPISDTGPAPAPPAPAPPAPPAPPSQATPPAPSQPPSPPHSAPPDNPPRGGAPPESPPKESAPPEKPPPEEPPPPTPPRRVAPPQWPAPPDNPPPRADEPRSIPSPPSIPPRSPRPNRRVSPNHPNPPGLSGGEPPGLSRPPGEAATPPAHAQQHRGVDLHAGPVEVSVRPSDGSQVGITVHRDARPR